MEATFKYNITDILGEINGETDLIPYWIKLDLLDKHIPIEINPLNVKDDSFNVEYGFITYTETDGTIEVCWKLQK